MFLKHLDKKPETRFSTSIAQRLSRTGSWSLGILLGRVAQVLRRDEGCGFVLLAGPLLRFQSTGMASGWRWPWQWGLALLKSAMRSM